MSSRPQRLRVGLAAATLCMLLGVAATGCRSNNGRPGVEPRTLARVNQSLRLEPEGPSHADRAEEARAELDEGAKTREFFSDLVGLGGWVAWDSVLGRFELRFERALGLRRSYEIEVVGIRVVDAVPARTIESDAYFRADPRPFEAALIARVGLDDTNPTATIAINDEIWDRWEKAEIVALYVVARSVPSETAEPAPPAETPSGKDRWRRMLSIERARWPGSTIELAATDEGLFLKTPRVNVPSAEARRPKP